MFNYTYSINPIEMKFGILISNPNTFKYVYIAIYIILTKINDIIFICQNGKKEVSSNHKRTEIYKNKLALNLCIL